MRKPPSIALLLVVGCGPTVGVDAGDTTTNADADDESESVPDPSVDPHPSTTLTTVDPTDATDEGAGVSTDDEDDDGSGFIGDPDLSGSIECDLWIDDCPLGQKCMPWANDGGNAWNATKCSPLAEDPNGVGEPCTVEGSGVSGIDDCESRAMCWYVDPETNVGTCVAMCSGSEANPTCDDACTSCTIYAEGMPILCLPACDPLQQTCSEGQGCYPFDDTFACSPDASADMGALGDPCEYINVCDPGLFCANVTSVPNCAAASGCCASFCNAIAEDPCASMPEGVECIPWFDEGEGPPCLSGVIGACVVPK